VNILTIQTIFVIKADYLAPLIITIVKTTTIKPAKGDSIKY